MLSIAFVLCAMQALALASPIRPEQGGTRIALSRRQDNTTTTDPDLTDSNVLDSIIGAIEECVARVLIIARLVLTQSVANTKTASTTTSRIPDRAIL